MFQPTGGLAQRGPVKAEECRHLWLPVLVNSLDGRPKGSSQKNDSSRSSGLPRPCGAAMALWAIPSYPPSASLRSDGDSARLPIAPAGRQWTGSARVSVALAGAHFFLGGMAGGGIASYASKVPQGWVWVGWGHETRVRSAAGGGGPALGGAGLGCAGGGALCGWPGPAANPDRRNWPAGGRGAGPEQGDDPQPRTTGSCASIRCCGWTGAWRSPS